MNLDLPKGIRNPNDIPLAEEVIKDWLKKLCQESTSEFEGNLLILSSFLKNNKIDKRIGILIDNLEPALNKDGKFNYGDDKRTKGQRSYVQLLKVLADPSVNALTLITTRYLLNEDIDNLESYPIPKLTNKAWGNFFKYWEISTTSEDLDNICETYQGNALAMKIFRGQIKTYYQSDLALFWQGERKENLLRNPDLKKLVSDQFKHLKTLDNDAYQLLYRLGCYRYQKFSSLPERGLLSLLWDNPEESKRKNIIDFLKDCSLVEFESDRYSVHPIILAESQLLLESSKEFKDVHINAAKFYYENADKITNSNQVKYAFEAIYHYYEAEDFQQCHQVLLHILDSTEKMENLRCSENLWLYIIEIIEVCERLNNKLTGLDKAINLIPLGVLYPEIGKNKEAVKVSEDILYIIEKLTQSKEPDQRMIIAQASAYLIAGRANKFVGNFPESFKACKESINLVEKARLQLDKDWLWKGLALYELGTAHLERSNLVNFYYLDPFIAFLLILRGALYSYSISNPRIYKVAYVFVTSPIFFNIEKKVIYAAEDFKNKIPQKSRDNDYTKEFRVIYNLGRCVNLIKIYGMNKLANALFKKALRVIGENEDPLNKTWAILGLASCLSSEKDEKKHQKAEKKYQEVLAVANFEKLSTLCKASVLFEYANFKYKQRLYRELKG